MEENKNKKSKALIITIILLVLLLVVGYLLFKNKDIFGVKTSSSIAKIFSPLNSSDNSKGLSKVEVQAGEDLSKGDSVSISTDAISGNKVARKTTSGNASGYAFTDIKSGEVGEVVLNDGNANNFWDSFSGFLGNLIPNNPDITSCSNGTDNPPLCTTIGGECLNNSTNPPECNDDGGIDICLNGADNFPDCTTVGGECLNGATNPPDCDDTGDNKDEGPDLVAGVVAPISTTINTPTKLSSIVTNNGKGSTGSSFSSFFSIRKILDVELYDAKNIELSTVIPTLESKVGSIASVSHTFTELGTYYIRVCADKKSSNDAGTVVELNEDNNCGQPTTFTVTNALPPLGSLPTCSDSIDNDGDNTIDKEDVNCHIGGTLDGIYMPDHTSESSSPVDPNAGTTQCSDTIDNDKDGKIDRDDLSCYIDGVYIASHISESTPPIDPPITNVCLNIDAHPLIFTAQEKADLADLLRKFYLIAPTLKTEDDIKLTYSEIDQYQNFGNYLTTLTDQCYAQVDSPTYTGSKTRYGNPWYSYDSYRGIYLDPHTDLATAQCEDGIDNDSDGLADVLDPDCHKDRIISPANNIFSYVRDHDSEREMAFDCKYISGWFSGVRGDTGEDCDTHNTALYLIPPASCTSKLIPTNAGTGVELPAGSGKFYSLPTNQVQSVIFQQALNNKCVWNEGVPIEDLQRILNVW